VARIVRGVARGVGAHPVLFTAVAVGMLGLHVLLPPLLLSLVRKPCDYFAFNAWLVNLPGYLVSDGAPIGVKAGKLWNLALFWFSAENPYGTEWGFAVDTGDLVRMVVASVLIAAYFALWRRRASVARVGGFAAADVARTGASVNAVLDPTAHGVVMAASSAGVSALARPSAGSAGVGVRTGFAGGLASVLGLTTGPCSVMGCGAPVMPVVGLVFAGLSSTTIAVLSSLAAWSGPAVLVGLTLAVARLGWLAGTDRA
jgi:hypothetical protein